MAPANEEIEYAFPVEFAHIVEEPAIAPADTLSVPFNKVMEAVASIAQGDTAATV